MATLLYSGCADRCGIYDNSQVVSDMKHVLTCPTCKDEFTVQIIDYCDYGDPVECTCGEWLETIVDEVGDDIDVSVVGVTIKPEWMNSGMESMR